MKIILTNPRGFCAGVNMAIQTVDKARAVDAMDRLRELVAKYRPDLSSASKTS